MRGTLGVFALAMLLLLPMGFPGSAEDGGPGPLQGDPVLRVGSIDEMKTRNPLPGIADDPWNRAVLDQVYGTVLLWNKTTEAPIAYVAKGVDANEDGTFTPSTEYDVWWEAANATTALTVTVYYDFNGVRWHDGVQVDVWDLLFSYHMNAMNPLWNSALRVLYAGGPGSTYEAGNRQLGVALGTKDWQGEASLPGDPTLRVAVTFTLNEPFALFPRTLAPTLLPMREWSRTGGGRHADFGCAIWLPPTEAAARGLPECGNADPAAWGRGIASTETVPGSKPYDYNAAQAWPLADADVIGSGPFTFTSWVQGIEVTLTRYAGYYTGVDAGNVYDPVLPTRMHKPYIGGIRFLIYRTAQLLLLALLGGQLDYVHGYVFPEFIPELLNDPGITVTSGADPGFAYLGYNLRREPWGYRNGDPAQGDIGYWLRQAVSHIIDKQAILMNFVQGFGYIAHGFVSPANLFWYNDNIPKPNFDLTQAASILDDMAQPGGLIPQIPGYGLDPPGTCSKDTPSGCRSLPGKGNGMLEILTPQADYDPVLASSGMMIADAMRQVGINADATPTSFGTIEQDVLARDYDLYVGRRDPGTWDPDYLFDFYDGSNAAAGRNHAGFRNATFDGTIEATRAELDRATRQAGIFTAQQELGSSRPEEPLYYRTRFEAYRSDRFVNWSLWAGSNWDYWSLIGIHPPARTFQLTVDTVPPGLRLNVSGAGPVTAPFAFNCTEGDPYTIAAPSPQVLGPSRFTFASWSDGGAQTHAVTCSANATITATFSVENLMTVETTPAGLNVTVDGVTSPAPVTKWCPRSGTIQVAVPSPQGSGDIRRAFASWSDAGAQTHAVSCVSPATVTATFTTEFRIIVDSNPPGAPLTVGGVTITQRNETWCRDGASLEIGAPAETTIGGRRYRFTGWSDGGAQSHAAACTAPATVVAAFQEISFVDQYGWVLAAIVAVVVLFGILVAFLRRRRKKEPTTWAQVEGVGERPPPKT